LIFLIFSVYLYSTKNEVTILDDNNNNDNNDYNYNLKKLAEVIFFSCSAIFVHAIRANIDPHQEVTITSNVLFTGQTASGIFLFLSVVLWIIALKTLEKMRE